MRPTVGIYQSRELFLYQMVLLQTVGHQYTLVILIERKRQFMLRKRKIPS